MWFSEKAFVFVDTRSAALAVYRSHFNGPRLLRFAFERFGARAREGALFADVLGDSREAVSRLARDLSAPKGDASLLLPLGVTFPSVVDLNAARRAQSADVDESDLVRFRLAPLLPFPVGQAEVRSEKSASLRQGSVLAQAILRTTIVESEKVMDSLGFKRARVTSALSAAFRGLPPLEGAVDLIFGDSACAVAIRDERGAMDAIHLRLLAEGDDRGRRSADEALRAAEAPREIRVLGEDPDEVKSHSGAAPVRPAFDLPALQGAADPQRFPFLAVFHEGASR